MTYRLGAVSSRLRRYGAPGLLRGNGRPWSRSGHERGRCCTQNPTQLVGVAVEQAKFLGVVGAHAHDTSHLGADVIDLAGEAGVVSVGRHADNGTGCGVLTAHRFGGSLGAESLRVELYWQVVASAVSAGQRTFVLVKESRGYALPRLGSRGSNPVVRSTKAQVSPRGSSSRRGV